MAVKIPFIESYLQDFKCDKDVNDIIIQNNCKIIPYSKIKDKTNFDEIDYVIIIEEEEFFDFTANNIQLYNFLLRHNKLFYVGKYCDELCSHSDDNFYNLKMGINIDLSSQYKKFFMPNLLINISLIKLNQNAKYKCSKIKKNFFNYLSSSVKQMNVQTFVGFKKGLLNNLPNKINIINFDGYFTFKRIKYPKNIIMAINEEHIYDRYMLSKRLKNILNVNTRKTLYKLTTSKGEINFHGMNEMYQKPADNIIIKDSQIMYLNHQHYERYRTHTMHRTFKLEDYHFSDNYIDEIINKEENYKHIWNTVCLKIYNKNLKKTSSHQKILTAKSKYKKAFISRMIKLKTKFID